MKNAAEIEKQIQAIKSALATERESVQDLESLIGRRIEAELWGLSKKELEKEAWSSFFVLEKSQDCLEEEPIVSPRKFWGPLIIISKKVLRALIRPYLRMILARQSRFNRELIRIILAIQLRLEKIEERIAVLEAGSPNSRIEQG
jgi:hypothetical protein